MKSKLKLKTAIILSFSGLMLIMIGSMVFLWTSSYQFLADQQGARIIGALSDYSHAKIDSFLGEPHRLSGIFAAAIAESDTSEPEAINRNRRFALELLKSQYNQLPQISVASYGDEEGRYLGYRVNDNGTYSLMKKDESTSLKLNIYDGETQDSKVLASYDGYDPRIRPWYEPVKKSPVTQWSSIYINIDEKRESTISTITPIINSKGVFKGVAELDIKLEGMNQFLHNDQTKGTGSVYIVDRDWRLVAQSGKSETLKIIQNDPPVAEPIMAIESGDQIISESAIFLRRTTTGLNQVSRLNIDDQSYYVLGKEVAPKLNLGWKIIVAIPENEIMMIVRENIQLSILVMLSVIVLGTLISLFIMSQLTNPIISVAKAALEISEGKWGIEIPMVKRPLYETQELIIAFNRMSKQIVNNLDQINEMHTKERERLEEAIKQRTSELELTMNELVNREKLASLGSLVSGISHEVNTPLGVSVTAASYMEETNKQIRSLIQDNKLTKSEFLSYLEAMEETAVILNTNLMRSSELIKSFKEIAVNQSNEIATLFNIEEYLGMVILSLRHEYKHTSHQFVIDCKKDTIVKSYPGAWSQIFTNLIMNSLRHAFAELDKGEMRIIIEEKSDSLVVEFSDNGCGIDETHRPYVFDPFFTTRRGSGGSGLGLNVIYNLVTGLLGGTIVLQNNPNEGAKFIITVPKM